MRFMIEKLQQVFGLILIIISLLGIQYVLGKKCSFPYGILMGLSPVFIGVLVLFSDFTLIPFALFMLEGSQKIPWLDRWRRRLLLNEERVRQSRRLRYAQRLGKLGIVAIVSIPLSGGVWTGVILSHLMGLKRFEEYVLIGLGSVIGCAIFVLSFIGIVHWVG